MKNFNQFILTLLAAGLLASCSLTEEPTSFVNRKSFYKNESQCHCGAQFVLHACECDLYGQLHAGHRGLHRHLVLLLDDRRRLAST